MKMPTQFKSEVIAELLGEKMLTRLKTAYLRGKVLKVKPVTVEDLKLARIYVEGTNISLKASTAFKRVAYKWVTEAKGSHKAFLRYTSDLITAGTKKYTSDLIDAGTKKKGARKYVKQKKSKQHKV
jgi:hypothetical protein